MVISIIKKKSKALAIYKRTSHVAAGHVLLLISLLYHLISFIN
jgi:hypothetical protein